MPQCYSIAEMTTRRDAIKFVAALTPAALQAQEDYKPAPESMAQPGVPKGAVTEYAWTSRIFPGTTRKYWVYVPAQYKADKPACVMVFQDGRREANVFDNLIHKGEVPVAIVISVEPGVLPASGPDRQARYNRSFEYDALGDRYARFLIEEILPEVGKLYSLSKDPNDYAIGGSSSGASAAFTVAWHRPDVFRRVLSFIGSYVNLRGGNVYSSLIRKTEPAPLRVFLQDGNKDLNIYSGDWWMANQDMASALQYAGYDAKFVTGTEGHNGKHAAAILPDALRWLWRDYGTPIKASKGGGGERQFVTMVLDPASDWEMVSSGHGFTEGPAVDKGGNVFFTDVRGSKIHRIGVDGQSSVWMEQSYGANGLMFGGDGRLYACQGGKKRIVSFGMDRVEKVLAEDTTSNDLCVTAKGDVYYTDPPSKTIWYIDANGKRTAVHKGLEFPNGVILSPDQSLLMAVDMRNKWVWSFQIQADGTLANEQPFYKLETHDVDAQSGGDGMTVDDQGFLYVATRLGVQVCDQPGRVVGIIRKPHAGSLSNVCFGGPDLDILYATAGDRVFRRRMRRKGVVAWKPVMPPKPGL